MPTPVARYTIVIDRYLTDDADGTGVYHDGTGANAAKQVAKELQEAWDCGGVAGHFRVIHRHVYDDDECLPGGYGARGLGQFFMDDPEPTPPPKVACVQCEDHGRERVCATVMAPRIKTCPTPDHPNTPYTYEMVALCADCCSDWWGTDERDRPADAPPVVALPMQYA